MIQPKLEELDRPVSLAQRITHKKDKIGRWTAAESYLFQSLLERYGKNWKKVHQHMKGRTLSQIRSHAQKYFDKVGPKKVQEFERRAKLLDAYETLQAQKRFFEMSQNIPQRLDQGQEILIKMQQQSPSTQSSEKSISPQQILPLRQDQNVKKEQIESQIKINYYQDNKYMQLYPSMAIPYLNGGYLMNIIYSDLVGFQKFGINNFIDDPNFRQ